MIESALKAPMGTTLYAYIEYDESCRFGESSETPFAGSVVRLLNLSDFYPLAYGKDYQFFSAISGWRDESGIKPLFSPRGIPPNASEELRDEVLKWCDETDEGLGWLTLDEIKSALTHHRLKPEECSLAVQLVLQVMGFLQSQLGDDRVRLVFVMS